MPDKRETALGMNRTGVATSPIDSKALVASAQEGVPVPGNGQGVTALRVQYVEEAEPIGSIPPPLTLKGIASTALQALKGQNVPVLIDLLGERLAFERTGSRLYQALIDKFQQSKLWSGGPSIALLETFRQQELAHFKLVKSVIEELGADPTVQTPSADVAGVASMGLLQVVTDPRISVALSLHAIHMAELVDADAWVTLAALADRMGLDEYSSRFQSAIQDETMHLAHVRGWMEAWTKAEAMHLPSRR